MQPKHMTDELCPRCSKGTLECIDRKGEDILQCDRHDCNFTYALSEESQEPETAEDYEDIKRAWKKEERQEAMNEAKREDWPECPTCGSLMKPDKMPEEGTDYPINVCTNPKCTHWESR